MKRSTTFALTALILGAAVLAAAPTPVVKVAYPGNLQGWFFYNDVTDAVDNSLGSFVFGPGTPPLG
ncbi:MAG: hypothetical protein NTV52_14020 [Acidobacteria bacterium]|nr:hypothetical protein [Acidobacteriota bacterium]